MGGLHGIATVFPRYQGDPSLDIFSGRVQASISLRKEILKMLTDESVKRSHEFFKENKKNLMKYLITNRFFTTIDINFAINECQYFLKTYEEYSRKRDLNVNKVYWVKDGRDAFSSAYPAWSYRKHRGELFKKIFI